MANIAWFGATGSAGRIALGLALERKHTVRALARDPSKLAIPHDNLTVIQGDISQVDAITRTLQGQDAVLITLGTGSDLRATQVLSEGTAKIVAAMGAQGVRRVVCLLSGWLLYPRVPERFVAITQEHQRQLDVLESSGLDWVAVCPPAIVDKPASGRYEVTLGRLPGEGYQEITRGDLAAVLLDALEEGSYTGQCVGLANNGITMDAKTVLPW